MSITDEDGLDSNLNGLFVWVKLIKPGMHNIAIKGNNMQVVRTPAFNCSKYVGIGLMCHKVMNNYTITSFPLCS